MVTMDDVTSGLIDGDGHFDKMMNALNIHLKNAHESQLITNEQVGTAYSSAIPALIHEAVNFELQKDLIAAQIDKAVADAKTAEEQFEISKSQNALERAKAIAEINKEYGYEYTIVNGQIVIGNDTGLGKIDEERKLVKQQVLTETNNTELVREKTESEEIQNKTDGMLNNQIEKIKADIVIAQEQAEIAKSQADREYAQMIASLGKELGYTYDFDLEGNIDRTSLSSSGNGKLDSEINLLKQQVLTEVNNTELVKEKTESESMQNKTDGIIDNQIAKLVKDVEIAEEQLLLSKSELALARSKAIADIDKNYGYNYSLDAEGNISVIDSSNDGKLDAEIDLLRQQALTEIKNTELVREKTESEAMQNQTDGVIDNQIEKMVKDIEIASQQVEIAKTNNSLERAKALAEISKQYGFEYTINETTGEINVTNSTENGKLDKELSLLTQQILTETNNTSLVQNKSNSEAKNNADDGVIDNQIEKIKADINLSSQQLEIAKSQSNKEYAQMLATLDKELGYTYEFDLDGKIDKTSLSSSGDGKIDEEIKLLKQQTLTETNNTELVKEKADLSKQQVDTAKLQTSQEKAKTIVSIEKEYGYNHTETDGVIDIGSTTGLGRIDKELLKIQAEINILTEQLETEKLQNDENDGVLVNQIKKLKEEERLLYVERVEKDKEAAALGMDDVVKNNNIVSESIYTPKYIKD